MKRLGYLGFVLLIAVVGFASCKSKAFHDKPMPTDPLAFRQYLMAGMADALKVTECQCCAKSLYKCYEETLQKEARRCPDT